MKHELRDLVGGADIADMLDVSPAAVANWTLRDVDFPKPILRISRGNIPIWSRQEVLEWAAKTGRIK